MGLGLGIVNEPLEYPVAWIPNEEGLDSNLVLWLQGDVGVSGSGWADSSSEGNDATQAIVGNRPTLTSHQGKDVLDFDQSGTPQFMDFTKITIEEDQTFTLAFAVHLDNMTNRVILSDSGNEFIEIMTSKKFRIKTNNPSNRTTVLTNLEAVFKTSTAIIVCLTRNTDGRFAWRINGENIAYDTSTSVNLVNTGGFDLQNLCIRNDNDRALDGRLFELLFYRGVDLDAVENFSTLVNLHRYLEEKFNIQNVNI